MSWEHISYDIILIWPVLALCIATFINKKLMWNNLEKQQRAIKRFGIQMIFMLFLFMSLFILMPSPIATYAVIHFEFSSLVEIQESIAKDKYKHQFYLDYIRLNHVMFFLISICALVVGELLILAKHLVDIKEE